MRALCIDDHEINRRVLVALLAIGGVEADEANSGECGLGMVDATDYDMIFMDLRMPVMDGVEAASRIRARQDDKSETPIILVTAEARKSLVGQVKEGLFDDALFKPVRPDVLFDAIAKVLMAKGAETV